MGNVWNNLYANFGGGWSRDTSFQANELKSQYKVQTTLGRNLITGGEENFPIASTFTFL